jgi:hypothetical protein
MQTRKLIGWKNPTVKTRRPSTSGSQALDERTSTMVAVEPITSNVSGMDGAASHSVGLGVVPFQRQRSIMIGVSSRKTPV